MTERLCLGISNLLDQLAVQPRFGEVRAPLQLARGLVENEHSKGADDFFRHAGARIGNGPGVSFVWALTFQMLDQAALLDGSLNEAGEQGMRIKWF